MTYREFYKKLGKLKGKYRIDNGYIRAKNPVRTGYCPLVGVSKLYKGPTESYITAGDFLGLSSKQQYCIVAGADGCAGGAHTRRAMLRVLGLHEEE